MSAPTIPCPQCGIVLRPPSSLAPGTRVRCTACGTVFSMEAASPSPISAEERNPDLSPRKDRGRRWSVVEDDDDERPRRSRRRRVHDDDEGDDDGRPRVASGGPGAGLVAAVVGIALLLGAGTALGLWVWLGSAPAPQRPPEAVVNRPPMVFQQGPVGNANPPWPVIPQPDPRMAAPNPAPKNDAPIPLGTLQALKAATVYVKVRLGAERASGSGFLVQSRGGAGFIVTNHHVVDPTDEPGEGPGMFPFGGNLPGLPPGFPQFPGMPNFPQPPGFGPRFGPFGLPMLRPPVFRIRPQVTVVLHSGTAQQDALNAEVVADDPKADLAVLRVRTNHPLPAPLNLQQKPDLAETLPVYILGFPFGAELAVGQADPAITVCKGDVSALRRSRRGELALVQITGEIHPGNSGGPVVDAQGRLVGIAVAKIRNTNIGFAIPAGQLSVVLSGRLLSASVTRIQVEKGIEKRQGHRTTFDSQNRVQMTTQFSISQPSHGRADSDKDAGPVLVEVQLVDPMQQIHSIKVAEARGDMSRVGQAIQEGETWQPLHAEATVPLNRREQIAEGTLRLDTSKAKGDLYTLQFSYVTANGRPIYTQPWAVHLNQVPVVPNAPRANQPFANVDIASTLEDLKAANRGKQWQALDRLARARPTAERRKAVVSALEALLTDRDWATRGKAVRALGVWGTKDNVPSLVRLLKDDQFSVRHAALAALGRIKDPSAAEAVAARLKELGDRMPAHRALTAMGPGAEKATRAYLKDGDLFLRVEVCNILADIGTKASLPALQDLAEHDDNPLVKASADRAVHEISQRVH